MVYGFQKQAEKFKRNKISKMKKRRTNGAWVQDIADQRSSFGTIIKQTKKKKGKGCACGKLWGEGGERERGIMGFGNS